MKLCSQSRLAITVRAGHWLFGVALLVVTVGCEETPVTVSGTVLLDGKPLGMVEGMRGTVLFQPASHQGPILDGTIDRRGHYQLTMGGETTVNPGTYLATVSAVEILPSTDENPQPTGRRITPDKYADSSASGLRVVVEPGVNNVILRLTSAQEDTSPESAEVRLPVEPADTAVEKMEQE